MWCQFYHTESVRRAKSAARRCAIALSRTCGVRMSSALSRKCAPTIRILIGWISPFGAMQERVLPLQDRKFYTVNQLKQALVLEWRALPRRFTDRRLRYSSSQNYFSFSFYKVWDQSFQYKFQYSIWIIFSSSFYKVFLEIISVQFQFQYLHHFINSFVVDNIRTQGMGFGRGCPPPNGGGVWWGGCQKMFEFFCREMVHFACILTHDYSSKKSRQRQTNNFSISF